jgi:hypothetical protein
LHPLAVADLARSGITPEQAAQLEIFDVADASTIYPEFWPVRALVIPYFNPDHTPMTFTRDGEAHHFCRVRYLEPLPHRVGFVKPKNQKYDQPRGSGQRVYFCPTIPWTEMLANATEPLVITEGEKKSIAACLAGVPTIGLGGVFNFKDGFDSLIAELEATVWKAREFFLCFDSDAATNKNIQAAEARLVDELQRKRGARGYLVRLPQAGDDKVGLDDFLLAHGVQSFYTLLQSAPALNAIDLRVIEVNRDLAWIEFEALAYDYNQNTFIKKDSLLAGSHWASLKHITTGATQRSGPKEVQVLAEWLKHPFAARYSEILFRPGEGRVVTENGRRALNMWRDLEGGEGDPTPFLELSEFLFSHMPEGDRDLILKIFAYKAQHPAHKIALAPVLLGEQGCGKTLWTEILCEAFAPYSIPVNPEALSGEFQFWIERNLIVAVNEAKDSDMRAAAEKLKTLISDVDQSMNEKFRKQRRVKSYCQYVITSNHSDVGAFSEDDRRMIVVECPPKRELEFYNRMKAEGEWRKGGGPKAVLRWLLEYDLGDWEPPASPPVTQAKINARLESLTITQELAESMKRSSHNEVAMWLMSAEAWAKQSLTSSNTAIVNQANAILDNVQLYTVRPWYTPLELSRIFPSVALEVWGNRMDRTTSAGRLAKELRAVGIKYLRNRDDERGFKWEGQWRQYLVVSDFEEWAEPITQQDFERQMKQWPTLAQYRGQRK